MSKKPEPKFGCVSFRSSRWRKASKCKLHIDNLLSSVKIHRTRRECMVRQSRSDIAQLLPNDRFSEALPKAKHFYEDERRLLAYDQIEYFCTSILQNISSLKDQSDVNLIPEETKEAMAGLIYAATRIGELNELQYVRSLFVQRFGLAFDKDCVELRPGNVVSSEIVKILDTKMTQDAISLEALIEISQKCHQPMKTVISRKKVMKENSKFLQPNLGESEERDQSSFMR
ncbi:hypothetical protein V5N11_025063 [Cardamine amara subsp. amara]|uniref:Uncharacterized protein n=1 Tax=Cardamine amara subsp. amara TaxID=228776 RepID=A0ABD1AUH5_CARAN